MAGSSADAHPLLAAARSQAERAYHVADVVFLGTEPDSACAIVGRYRGCADDRVFADVWRVPASVRTAETLISKITELSHQKYQAKEILYEFEITAPSDVFSAQLVPRGDIVMTEIIYRVGLQRLPPIAASKSRAGQDRDGCEPSRHEPAGPLPIHSRASSQLADERTSTLSEWLLAHPGAEEMLIDTWFELLRETPHAFPVGPGERDLCAARLHDGSIALNRSMVITVAGRLAGVILVDGDEEVATIILLGVPPAFRGRSISTRLRDACFHNLHENEVRWVQTLVHPHNRPIISAYRQAAAEVIGRRLYVNVPRVG